MAFVERVGGHGPPYAVWTIKHLTMLSIGMAGFLGAVQAVRASIDTPENSQHRISRHAFDAGDAVRPVTTESGLRLTPNVAEPFLASQIITNSTYRLRTGVLTFRGSPDCNDNGIPDECDLDCGVPGGPCDVSGCGQSLDCLPDRIPDECQLGPNDCNGNSVPDDCDIANGASTDCNSNDIPDECDLDGCPLDDPDCADCDGSGLPDLCDIVACAEDCSDGDPPCAACGDCNNNRVPDSCDLASGASADDFDIFGNPGGDGIPDECKLWDVPAAGSWNQGANWANGNVPGLDGGALNESVVIDEPGANVTLDVNVSIDSLIVGADSALDVSAGDLFLDSPNGIRNDGALTVGAGHAIIASSPTLLAGAQPITLTDASAAISSATPADVITNLTTLGGTGAIQATLLNQGLVVAGIDTQQFEELTLAPPAIVNNENLLQAVGHGRLVIADGVTVSQSDTGRIEAMDGGLVDIDGVVNGFGGLRSAGGSIFINFTDAFFGDCIDVPPTATEPNSILTVTASILMGGNDLNITGGTVRVQEGSTAIFSGPVTVCPDTLINPQAVAVLDINDSTLIAGSLNVCPDGVLIVASSISLSGDFSFSMKDATDWSWDDGSILEMTGGVGLPDDDPSGYAKLEVAGYDYGDDLAGYEGNFDLAVLEIGPGAHVRLVDLVFNEKRGGPGGTAETVYVDTLRFADESGRLDLNGLNLYYGAIDPPDADCRILDFSDADGDGRRDPCDNCPTVFNPNQLDCDHDGLGNACDFEEYPDGDANRDGVVDPLDLGFVQSRFSCAVGAGDPLCDRADVNGDGAVDPLDSGYVLARFCAPE